MLLAVPLLHKVQFWAKLAACYKLRDPAVLRAMCRGLGVASTECLLCVNAHAMLGNA